MSWTEKGKPSPFDEQPISGLFFLDGDLIARTQQPDLPQDWARGFQGLKYPVVIFPSGTEGSVVSEEGETLVCIHRQMRLPYFSDRDRAYEQATTLAEEHQTVQRVGDAGVLLRLDDPHKHILVTYDNQAKHMIDLDIVEPATDEVERLLQLKDELLERFHALPPGHQATMGLLMVKSILAGEWGAWFHDTLTTRFRLGDTAHVPPYMFQVSRDHLRRVHVSEDEIAALADSDLMTIASLIHEHYITDAFWDELAFITDLVLAGKKRKP